MTQPTFFDPLPEPPTGPAAEVPTPAQNRYTAYCLWRLSREGIIAFQWFRDQALADLRNGATRISVDELAVQYRRHYGALNNTWRAWIADDLVLDHPCLLDLIERRRRKKAKV